MSEPRHALPAMRPRCCLRNLTFLGIIMAVYLLIGSRRSLRAPWAACLRKPVSPRVFRGGRPVSRTAASGPSVAAESELTDAGPDAAGPTEALASPGRQAAATAPKVRGLPAHDDGRAGRGARRDHGAVQARATSRGAWWCQ